MSVSSIATPDTVPTLPPTIANVAPFRDLPADDIDAIEAIAYNHDYKADETIYSFGQFDGSEFFLVQSGTLKVSRSDPQSGEMLIDQYSKGMIFGLAEAVIGDTGTRVLTDPASLTLLAATDLTVAAIDAAAFCDLAHERPAITRALMTLFARVLATGSARNQTDASPERAVYATLLGLVVRDEIAGTWHIERMPKHRDLALQSGTEEPVAAQAIARIIQDAIARRHYPGLVIDDIGALRRLAE